MHRVPLRPGALLPALLLVFCGLFATASDRVAGDDALAGRGPAERGVSIRAGQVVRRSTFYIDADGWTVVGRGVRGPYLCHKMLCADDEGRFAWHWSAPARFLAAMPKAYGGRLVVQRGFFEIVKLGETEWDMRGMPFDLSIESGTSGMKVQQFGLVGFGQFALEHSLELDMSGNWTMESGRPADEATLRHVLSTASRLLIRGGYYRGNETAFLRSVELIEPPAVRARGHDEGGDISTSIDAGVCENVSSESQCRDSRIAADPQPSTVRRKGVGVAGPEGASGGGASDQGALQRALKERLFTEVSGKTGLSSQVALSENESAADAGRGADGGRAGRAATRSGAEDMATRDEAGSETTRKQRVEAEMQARRLGRSLARDDRRPQERAGAPAVEGRYAAVWDETGASEADQGLLSCGAFGQRGAGWQQPRQDLLRVASDRGLPLNACLFGNSAAFGLASGAVVYVEAGDSPQVVSLREIESVSTDSDGAIVFLGAPPVLDGAGGVQPVLLRGCKMATFDLDDMTSFFELVQQLVAGVEAA